MDDDLLEQMCEKYWDAYRDGYHAVGGLDYPTWAQSRGTPMAQETYRCMRHAAEALKSALPIFRIEEAFPNPPMSRDEAVNEMKLQHLPLIQIMQDAQRRL